MQSISEWLESLGLERYTQAFLDNDIDIGLIAELSDEELEKLGVASLGHRKKLLKAIAQLNNSSNAVLHSQTTRGFSADTSERRQLTVLFCDMVGFTEIASRLDPEVLQNIVRVYEDTCAAFITRYDGYVFQRLGDGIVAFFGYPLAHEGEAERAIRAGLDIIDALADLDVPEVGHLSVRIGIATGLVVVSSAEKGAVGETMNLASRLQSIAPIDSIVVSERVQRLAGRAFEYEDLGKQDLKGIAQPSDAYRILGIREVSSRFEATAGDELTPLVGREEEIGILLRSWQLAQEGEGQVVMLSGEPGIGKSRILSALRERLEAQGAKALRFQCSPYHINSTLWPSIDNFERALNFGRDESAESKLDKLESLIVGHYARPLADVRFVASILSIPCEERYGEISMTPQKFKDETLRTLVDLTEAAARKQPSMLLFEDAHWADPTTLEVLDLMIDRARDIPLLMVLTHRPEFQNRWADHGHVSGLNLSKLTRAQSATIVSRLAGGKSLPDELLEQIINKTDGVPLFVEELTKSVLESGELKELADRYEYVGSAHSVTIPATLRDSLMARLDRYAPMKEIAQIGAAIGREFSFELISAVAPLTTSQLDDALTQLTDSGLAFRRGTPPDALYTFKHALVQDAAYDSLLKRRRQQLHAKIANAIEAHFPQTKETEPEILARHQSAAGRTEAAIALWQKAGELAFKRMALNETISHLNKGLELVGTLPQSRERDTSELDLRIRLGTAWMALKGWAAQEVWTSYHPALTLAKSLGRSDALLPILGGLMVHVLTQGRVAESLSWVEEMLDAANSTAGSSLFVTGHLHACIRYFWLGELSKFRGHGEIVLARYGEREDRNSAYIFPHDLKITIDLYDAQVTWMLGRPDEAVRLSDAKDERARHIGHPFELGWALSFGASVFDFRHEPALLRAHANECEQLGRENSLPVLWACMAPMQLGIADVREGKASEGMAQLKAGLTAWDASGEKIWSPYAKSVLAEAMAKLGDIDGALQLIGQQIEQVERPGWEERIHYAEILRLKGWMLEQKGDHAGAEKNYLASLDWAREQQAKSWELRTSTNLARLWRRQGKTKKAHDLLAPVYDWFTEGFDTKDLKDAKTLLDELAA